MLIIRHGGHVHEPPTDANKHPFDYLLPDLPTKAENLLPGDPVKVASDLKKLGAALIDSGPAVTTDPAVKVNSTIPAIYTYWGQFIDHDMTANTDRDSVVSDITKEPLTPVAPADVTDKLKNLRRPTFDLDSVYGNGPGLDGGFYQPDPGPADKGFYDGIRLRVGKNATQGPGVKIPPDADLSRDLPRIGPLLLDHVITEDDIPDDLKVEDNTKNTFAWIGDGRNDENLIVAQFHLAVLRFHNKAVDEVEKNPGKYGLNESAGDAERFEAARRLVRYHYQWLCVNDYLKTVTLPGIVDKILVGGTKHYKPLEGPDGGLFAPLEYSVAAFRFGHSMVRGGYDHNRNFGSPVPPNVTPLQRFASFEDLFRFTGDGHELLDGDITKSKRSPFRGALTLPFNWIIEWERMSNKADANEAHYARKIDTRLAPAILNMVNQGNAKNIQDDAVAANKPLRQLLRGLAVRNLLRGYLLSIPTGQAVAKAMDVEPLSEGELRQGNTDAVNLALQGGGFLVNTPLWFYILKEAEVRANGNSLGELGSRIVVETQIGIMQNDDNAYMKAGWDPSQGVQLPNNGGPIVTIRDFFAFADLAA